MNPKTGQTQGRPWWFDREEWTDDVSIETALIRLEQRPTVHDRMRLSRLPKWIKFGIRRDQWREFRRHVNRYRGHHTVWWFNSKVHAMEKK